MSTFSWGQQAFIALVGISLFFSIMLVSGAFFVRTSCRIGADFIPPYNMTFKAVFVCMLATAPITAITSILGVVSRGYYVGALILGLAIVSFLLTAWLLGIFIKHPEHGAIGIRKAAVVSIIWVGLGFVVVMIIGILAAIIIPKIDADARLKEQGFHPLDETTTKQYIPSNSAKVEDPAPVPVPTQPTQQGIDPVEQQRLNAVAVEVMQKYPMLNYQSPMKNQAAIDEVVSRRDVFIRTGIPPSEALKKAANLVGDRLLQTTTSATYHKKSAMISDEPGRYQTMVSRDIPIHSSQIKCVVKPVMSNEEIALCK